MRLVASRWTLGALAVIVAFLLPNVEAHDDACRVHSDCVDGTKFGWSFGKRIPLSQGMSF
jgi:hypothetical protein